MEDITQVFINLYRGFPCLYDTSLSVYKSKEISKKAYLDLASSSGMSVAQVKAKIKNLRTCYTRHLWSLKEYNEKKASGMDVKPPCWRYFPDMDFLRSHCTIRRVTFAEVCGSAGEKAIRFVGEADTGTGAGETNGQAPEQMRSLEQRRLEVPTPEEKGSVLEFSPNVLRRWKAVRKTQSLTTNTDTAQFLLEFFERERAKVDSRCVLCHRPLTLYCLVCDEPAPETHNASTSPPPQKHNAKTVEKRPRRKVAQKHKKVRTKEPLRKQTVSSGTVRLNKSKDGSKESSREETLNSAEMCMVVKKEEEDGEGFDQVQLLMSVDDEADSEDSKKTSLSPPPPLQACYRLTERQQMIEDGLAKTEEEEKVMEECSERTLTSGDTCAVDVKTEESESQRVMSVDDFEPDSLIELNSPLLSLPPTQQTTDPATATGGNWTIGSGHTKTQEHNSLREQSGEDTDAAEDASAIVLNEGKTESQQRQPKTSAHDSSGQASKQTSSKPPGRQMQDTSGQLFPCSQCTKVFTIKKSLKQHVRRHDVGHQFRCQFCSASFGHASVLKAHLRSHTGERPYACETCGKGFASASGLKVHTIVHTGLKPCLCQVCGATFRNASNLKTHMVRHHTKEKPFACDQCGRAFMCAPYLTRHMRIHTKERPFLCSKCGASFRCMGTLAMHVNTHKVVTPTGRKCRICGEEFSELSQLVSHNKLAHAEEKPYQCKLCGAVFAHAPSLTVHKRSHTGERPYKCKLCQAAFVCSNKLTEHMRKHTGEKKMRQCTQCDRVFSSSSGFQTHLNWHAGRRPYSCDVCGRTYTKKHTLMIHKMRKHPLT